MVFTSRTNNPNQLNFTAPGLRTDFAFVASNEILEDGQNICNTAASSYEQSVVESPEFWCRMSERAVKENKQVPATTSPFTVFFKRAGEALHRHDEKRHIAWLVVAARYARDGEGMGLEWTYAEETKKYMLTRGPSEFRGNAEV